MISKLSFGLSSDWSSIRLLMAFPSSVTVKFLLRIVLITVTSLVEVESIRPLLGMANKDLRHFLQSSGDFRSVIIDF